MSLTASGKDTTEYEIAPAGQYISRCYKIIDLGTQEPNNPTFKAAHKVIIYWELLDEAKMTDGRPFSVNQTYTVSLHDKATLRAHLESWRNKPFTKKELEGFDLKNILGAYCLVQVFHDETNTYANVKAIMAYKGDKPNPVNPNVVFDIDNPDMAVFETLSDNMKAKIQSAPEWKFNHLEAAKPEPSKPVEKEDVIIEDVGEEINLDDIPF